VRVLTVRQPWAWAIVHGGKGVENRSRNIAGSYRGPVAIHTAKTWAGDDALAIVEDLATADCPGGFILGEIIGVVDLIDVHVSDTHAERWNVELERNEQCSAWAMPNHHHLVLANPRAIEPIPAKGKLGLWKPDAELLAQIERAQ